MMRWIVAGVLLVGPAFGQATTSPVSPVEARNPAQVRAFRADHACPGTNKLRGACPGFVVDHLWPLACGGPDEPWNMAWQAKAESYKKDVLERRICLNLRRKVR